LGHVTIGADVSIGTDCMIHPGVRIADHAEMGDRIIVHPNVVIGSAGFSFVPGSRDGASDLLYPQRIHSLGKVIIEDDVEIGAGTTIDRATMSVTRIGRGTKIDNLVQIAHNVTIGQGCLICAMAGISGSVKIGDRVLLGGRAGIADHVTIGSDAAVAAGSGVGTNVPAGTQVSGYPAVKHERSLENFLYLGRQKALHARVAALQGRVEALELGQKDETT
jgi:UDP-3-O-[3-hydroxymyristoyl] glucosamine N-acyltransferase